MLQHFRLQNIIAAPFQLNRPTKQVLNSFRGQSCSLVLNSFDVMSCTAQRQIGETSLHETSSRSHQILRFVWHFPRENSILRILKFLWAPTHYLFQTIESSAREFIGKDNSTTLAASVVQINNIWVHSKRYILKCVELRSNSILTAEFCSFVNEYFVTFAMLC